MHNLYKKEWNNEVNYWKMKDSTRNSKRFQYELNEDCLNARLNKMIRIYNFSFSQIFSNEFMIHEIISSLLPHILRLVLNFTFTFSSHQLWIFKKPQKMIKFPSTLSSVRPMIKSKRWIALFARACSQYIHDTIFSV